MWTMSSWNTNMPIIISLFFLMCKALCRKKSTCKAERERQATAKLNKGKLNGSRLKLAMVSLCIWSLDTRTHCNCSSQFIIFSIAPFGFTMLEKPRFKIRKGFTDYSIFRHFSTHHERNPGLVTASLIKQIPHSLNYNRFPRLCYVETFWIY